MSPLRTTNCPVAARSARGLTALICGDGGRAADDLALVDSLAELPIEPTPEYLELSQLATFSQSVREDWDRARATSQRVIVDARHLGLPGVLGFGGALRGEIDLRTGHWAEAQSDANIDVSFNSARTQPTAYHGHVTLAQGFPIVMYGT